MGNRLLTKEIMPPPDKLPLDTYINISTAHHYPHKIIKNRRLSNIPARPLKISYIFNEFNNLELKNTYYYPWPRFIYDDSIFGIIGIQKSNGHIGTLSHYDKKICKAWQLPFITDPNFFDL